MSDLKQDVIDEVIELGKRSKANREIVNYALESVDPETYLTVLLNEKDVEIEKLKEKAWMYDDLCK